VLKPAAPAADADGCPNGGGLNPAIDELRSFLRHRRQVGLELTCSGSVAGVLFALEKAVDGSNEARAVYLAAWILYSLMASTLVARAIGVAIHACPRCSRPFHGRGPIAVWNALSALPHCACCGLSPRAPRSVADPAEEEGAA
jgi:hypothetical protein